MGLRAEESQGVCRRVVEKKCVIVERRVPPED